MATSDDKAQKQRIAKYMTMMSTNNIEILSPLEDPISLECAAYRSRLPFDRMTLEERACFAEMATLHKAAEQYYLYLRNKMLQHWLLNSREQLTAEDCLDIIPPPYNEDTSLVERTHKFLERYGYINFGVYAFRTYYPRLKKTVLVLGAGVAGLTAARQLECFGFDVMVVEARNRVGGRISTLRKDDYVAELGAMVITGMGGNPLMTLAKQIPVELRAINSLCPLFDDTGKPVPKDKDEVVEHEFNRLLQGCAYLAHTLNVEETMERKFSLGETIETVIHMQEKYVRERYYEHMKAAVSMQKRLIVLRQLLGKLREHISALRKEADLLERDKEKPQEQIRKAAVCDFLYRSQLRDLDIICGKYETLVRDIVELESSLQHLETNGPSEIYLNASERSVLDWHIANLEFANGAPLDKLSLKHWDQDDENEFSGPHLSVQNGLSTIPIHLAEGLNILHNKAVREVTYTENGVEITIANVNENGEPSGENAAETERLKADAVICTIPLGILKKSIADHKADEEKDGVSNTIKFTPPLPDWKKASIERMGYGNLNKVILFFDRIFWDPQLNMFGHVASASSARGEMFLFWSLYPNTPVLVALVAGEAADVAEQFEDQALVHRCVTILRIIFGIVPQPKDYAVTRWGRDPWSLGTYSYVSVEATGDDFDILAKPVSISDDGPPTLFFAGEHTWRHQPSTVAGAMLSGLREAGRISDRFFGPI